MIDIIKAVEKQRDLMFEAEEYIWNNPETGYKEYKTTAYLVEKFEELGYELVKPDDITGFYTVIDTGREGPEVLILAELDSVICPNHPESDTETGAVHACGHHVQSATLLGIAGALKEEGILDKFCGRIRLCAVPAEELLEMEFRQSLMKEGKIKYYGGKTEFLHRGYFDGVDIAFMVHTGVASRIMKGSVGILAKTVEYKGMSAHAGSMPWMGKNALYAATCGINAVNAIRETFEEADLIRFHPIITNGGDMVNAIPERAKIETFVRSKTFDGMLKNNKRINQALIGSALSLDNNVEINDMVGYAPLLNDQNLTMLAKNAYEMVSGGEKFEICEQTGTGSTDMGDLSCIMPAIHPYIGCAEGNSHGSNYKIVDREKGLVLNAKWQLTLLLLLLRGNGEGAKKIIKEHKPMFESREAYFEYIDSLESKGTRIDYTDRENVKVKL